MSQRKVNQEVWMEHVRAYEASGLSRLDFCRQHQLSVSMLRYYHKQLLCKKAPPAVLSNRFVEVTLPSSSGNHFLLHLPNGIKVEVPIRCEEKSLRNLIEVLRSC